MNTNGNAHPTVGAVEQAQAGNVLADNHSRDYCTSNPVACKLKISDFLGTGRQNAVPLCQLVKITDYDGRIVRRMIAEERFAGVPILADNKTGYYLPANEDERRRCVRSMRHRAKEIDRAAQAIEAADLCQDYRLRKPAQRVPESTIGQMRMEGI